MFNWILYDADELDVKLEQFDPALTISANYMNNNIELLNSKEKQFIKAMNHTYYSYYTILEVERGKALVLQDILLNTTHRVKEKQGTYQLQRGNIVFGRILTLDHQSIFIGMAPFVIPVHYNTMLIDFKEWLTEENDGEKLSGIVLRNELEMELIDYFFSIMTACFNQAMPQLSNTDGEMIQFSKSYFKLKLPIEQAVELLLPLTLEKQLTGFLKEVFYDQTGAIKQIKLPWLKKGNKKHKQSTNTVMGNITIEENKLIVETNSQERAEKIKKILIKHLGDNVIFQQTLIEIPERKLKSSNNSRETNEVDPEFLNMPEVQEQIKQFAKEHWERWFDEPIIALNNKTPRQAAKTKKGRERLEALLLQYETNEINNNVGENIFQADLDYLREELNL